MNRCAGCGSVIQTTNPDGKGYIDKEVLARRHHDFYCERCFNLIHYNRLIPIKADALKIKEYIDVIAASRSLVVNVVDVFDLAGSFLPEINQYFPDNPILFLANKADLFLKSVKINRITAYLQDFLAEKKMTVTKIHVVSAQSGKNMRMLLNTIRELKNNNNVYFFGMTNVGKSSLINGLSQITKGQKGRITVSNITATTLDFIKVNLPDKTVLIDTPGIINPNQVIYNLNYEHQRLLTPKKYIRPLIYQLMPGQALFIGGFGILEFTAGIASSFVIYVPAEIIIHRTKIENAIKFYREHCDDILKIPNPEEREKLGSLVTVATDFGPDKIDITFSGLGFVTLVGTGRVNVTYYEKIKVGFRKAII